MIRPLIASTAYDVDVTETRTWTGDLVRRTERLTGTQIPAPPPPVRLAWLIAVTRHLASQEPRA